MYLKRCFVPKWMIILNCILFFRVLSFGTITDCGILDGNEVRLMPAVESGLYVSFILIHKIIGLLKIFWCVEFFKVRVQCNPKQNYKDF